MLGLQLALESDVGAEDARVLVVAVEDADAGEEREVPGGVALGGSRFGHTGMSPKPRVRGSRSSAGCRWS